MLHGGTARGKCKTQFEHPQRTSFYLNCHSNINLLPLSQTLHCLWLKHVLVKAILSIAGPGDLCREHPPHNNIQYFILVDCREFKWYLFLKSIGVRGTLLLIWISMLADGKRVGYRKENDPFIFVYILILKNFQMYWKLVWTYSMFMRRNYSEKLTWNIGVLVSRPG